MNSGTRPSNITVITVCYNSESVINGMVDSVPNDFPIILVDNGGEHRLPDFSEKKNVQLVKLTSNEGFGRGCNAGADFAQTPYVLFLNPDARLESGALEALSLAAERYPSAVAFNPRISEADGGEYFKRRSYLLPRKRHLRRGWPAGDTVVPILSGAAMLVRKPVFDKVGGFDPKIFLYHEDDDLSLRLQEHGQLMFIYDAVVYHAGGHGTGRSARNAYIKAYHMAKSRIYTGRKHKRPMPEVSAILDFLMLCVLPTTWLSKRRRSKVLGFLSGLKHEIFGLS